MALLQLANFWAGATLFFTTCYLIYKAQFYLFVLHSSSETAVRNTIKFGMMDQLLGVSVVSGFVTSR